MDKILKMWVGDRHKVWNLETFFLALVGVAMILMKDIVHDFSVVQETIVLVVMLGGLMGITRIPFPSKVGNYIIPLWAYPIISGIISGFMDSFLVLLLVGAASLVGSEWGQFRFKAFNMIAALIGGLIMYFGEVYMLPLALHYGMRFWFSMLPVLPPVLVFLAFLAWRTSKLDVQVLGMKTNGHEGKKAAANAGDYFEFAAFIGLLLITHNALLCTGILFLYAFITGEGEDLLDVMKTETEMGVMLLLVFAAFVAEPIAPYMGYFQGWLAFIPSTINGVLTGAVFPVSGNVWRDTHILSTAVLLTPVSSLVGVMLFKSIGDWGRYIKLAVPLAVLWFLVYGAWFYGVWPYLDTWFYGITGHTPELVDALH